MDYQKVYTGLISFRKSNPLKKSKNYSEVHHILPRCLGGTDNSENLVRLAAREHFIAHRLLAKIHKGNTGLTLAVLLMACKQGSAFMNSRLYELYRTEHAEIMSKRMLAAWEDGEYREKASVVRGSIEYREKLSAQTKKLWGNEEFREKVSTVMESEEYREKMSAAAKKRWGDEDHREKNKRFLETNPWPWQRPRAQPTKRIWTLAATFYELRMDESTKGKRYGYVRFSNDFCGGNYEDIFRGMICMFKEGWVPQECPAYLEEFGDRM